MAYFQEFGKEKISISIVGFYFGNIFLSFYKCFHYRTHWSGEIFFQESSFLSNGTNGTIKFPPMTICLMTMFFPPDWISKTLRETLKQLQLCGLPILIPAASLQGESTNLPQKHTRKSAVSMNNNPEKLNKLQKLLVIVFVFYFAMQITLPCRYLLEEHRAIWISTPDTCAFSWRMMMVRKEMLTAKFFAWIPV